MFKFIVAALVLGIALVYFNVINIHGSLGVSVTPEAQQQAAEQVQALRNDLARAVKP
jgi:hypothetical protein